MAERTLAILVTAKGAIEAARNIGKVNTSVGTLGRTAAIAGQGVRTAGANIARFGLLAGAAVGVGVRGGLASLGELESATTSVAGAISQMGLDGRVSAGEIATWANQIEANVGAAFDDKAIVQATSTLIRFGKVTPGNIRPAMEIITDLATKTGDVDSAATLLAKALADPTKAAGKLARSGVVLTKAQQDQITAFVKTGKTAEAQKVILDSLAETTKGAAAASQGPYKRAMSVLADVTEDAQRALATGFLPVVERVADLLGKELAKPETLKGIREFGQGLAGGLDKAIDVARGLPWATIGDSLRIGGMGAKAIFDAFMDLPPWVQTAVLTGWGLNKLTGGAIGGIVGELGKGLIKGVLGMNAGVVNLRAGVVNGGGAGGAGAVGGAGRGSRLGSPLAAIGAIAAIPVIAELVGQKQEQTAANEAQAQGVIAQGQQFGETASASQMRGSLQGIEAYTRDLRTGLTPEAIAYQLNIDGVRDRLDEVKANLQADIAKADERENAILNRLEARRADTGPQPVALSPDDRDAVRATSRATDRMSTALESLRAQIRATPPPQVTVNVAVTARAVQETRTTWRRQGNDKRLVAW